jgi:hypothetical protein
VAASEQDQQQFIDHRGLTDNNLGEFGADPRARTGELFGGLFVLLEGSGCG